MPILFALSLQLEGWDIIKSSLESTTMVSVYVVVWQSIGNTMIGYGLWNYLLHQYNAALVLPWALLVPVSGMAASLVLLGLLVNIIVSKRTKANV